MVTIWNEKRHLLFSERNKTKETIPEPSPMENIIEDQSFETSSNQDSSIRTKAMQCIQNHVYQLINTICLSAEIVFKEFETDGLKQENFMDRMLLLQSGSVTNLC